MATASLVFALRQARDDATNRGTQPIPLHIRAQLETWYDFAVLDTVRYRVGDEQQVSAANAMLQNPDVNAVTLIDTVIFRRAADAEDNVALWAHELKHVQQYQELGWRNSPGAIPAITMTWRGRPTPSRRKWPRLCASAQRVVRVSLFV